MAVVYVLAALAAVALLAGVVRRTSRARRIRRRRSTMFIPTYPGIELEQPYGPWDIEDASGDGQHVRQLPTIRIQPGMPSRWARLL